MSFQVIIEATDIYGQRSNPTAIELASALTYAHRLINRAIADGAHDVDINEYGKSTLRSEPALANLQITKVANGSVVLQGAIEMVSSPFVQGVAGGVLANIISPGIAQIARRAKRALMRPARASEGRTITVTITTEHVVLQTHCSYENRQRTQIIIEETNS